MANRADEQKSLQDLFASLRPPSGGAQSIENRSQGSPAPSNPHFFFNPTNARSQSENFAPVSQSTTMPQVFNGLNTRAPAMPSSGATPKHHAQSSGDQSGPDRTANLLNLLRFDQGAGDQQTSDQRSTPETRPSFPGFQSAQGSATQNIHGRGVSASDLVASFMGKSLNPDLPGNSTQTTMPGTSSIANANANANPQDYLLQLLNRTQVSQPKSQSSRAAAQSALYDMDTPIQSREAPSAPNEMTSPPNATSSGRNDSPIRIFGTAESKEPTPFEPQDMPKVDQPKEPIFTYVNPFEQIAASSPRNAKSRSRNGTPSRDVQYAASRLGSNGESARKKSKVQSATPGRASPHDNLTTGANEVLQSIESPTPHPLDDGRSQLEALIGIGAPTTNTETVAQALNDVGEQVSRQVDYALAQADQENKDVQSKDEEEEEADELLEERLQDAAIGIKEEMEEDEGDEALESIMPEEMAAAVKNVIEEAAAGNVDGHRGSADDENSSGKGDDDFVVPVYNFPMKPFVSIDLQHVEAPTLYLRKNTVTDIARFKKEFDQVDRALATATNEYIVYAMPKPGGFRVIRQDDGLDRQVFKETRDHVFNVAISTTPGGTSSHGLESCIATAVSGSVYWAALQHLGKDHVQMDIVQQHCLVFPPVPARDDNTSGGQLKTRAKRSSRHPEFFAIGRGKSIQIVFPLHARSSNFVNTKGIVDTEKYFKNRSLKINTGKAGKDFTFSEDDTTIATLDKAGRLRFWDVRELVRDHNGGETTIDPVDVRAPLLTFTTSSPNEKSWPTSVLFVDKIRAYAKGTALRYVIVGMKQNHTLQLWDLGLGKAVQELNFPHEKEPDAICSVAYHAASGIVVVGHPTRNAIYFIHLSAPKYNLQGISQAKYIQRLADGDSSLPKPESTAIMSGLREYSFASKGQLRSVDLLPVSAGTSVNRDDPGLFELYVMHSKGVTCLNIRKADLGWSEDSKVMDSRDAVDAGYVVVRDLREPPPPLLSSEPSSVNGDNIASVPSAKVASKVKNNEPFAQNTVDPIDTVEPIKSNAPISNAPEKAEKRRKKKGGATAAATATVTAEEPPSSVPPPAPVPPTSYAATTAKGLSSGAQPLSKEAKASPSKKPSSDKPEALAEQRAKPTTTSTEPTSSGISADSIDKELQKLQQSISTEFSKTLNGELEALYRKFDEDKRVHDAASAAKQDAILRLVSSTLTENVEKSLSRIIVSNISQSVVPSIHKVTTSTLRSEVPDWLSKHLLDSLPAQLKLALPEAVSKAVQSTDVLHFLSEQLGSKLSAQIERQLSSSLQKSILPAFQTLVIEATQKQVVEAEQRINDQVQRANLLHQQDSAKIDQLTELVRALTETVHAMASAQSDFQSEILKAQQQSLRENRSVSSTASRQYHETALQETLEAEPSVEQQELERIAAAMAAGQFEEGTILVSDM